MVLRSPHLVAHFKGQRESIQVIPLCFIPLSVVEAEVPHIAIVSGNFFFITRTQGDIKRSLKVFSGPVPVPTALAQLAQVPVIDALFPRVLEFLTLLQGFFVMRFLLVPRLLLAINPS